MFVPTTSMFVIFLILLALLIGIINPIRYSSVDFRPLMIRRKLIWKQQLDIGDPQNWYPVKRFPCPQDKVVLPENYVVFVDRKMTVAELILPENGELVVSKDDGAIKFSVDDVHEDEELFEDESNNYSQCHPNEPSKTLYFRPDHQESNFNNQNSWFDPENWYLTFDFDTSGPVSSTYQISTYATFHQQQTSRSSITVSPLIPDSERIPCRRDFVDFPTNGSWRVVIGSRTQLIPLLGSLSLGQIYQFRTGTFRQFVSSFLGQMLFNIQGYNHIEIEPLSLACRASQCSCGNDHPKKMKEICQYRLRKCRITMLPCRDPIRPPGFCCPICASSLVIRLKKAGQNTSWFIYRLLIKHLEKLYQVKEPETQKSSLYIHWLYDGSIQVLISAINMDGKSRGKKNPLLDSHGYMEKLYQRLTNDGFFKLITLTKQSSIDWIFDTTLFDSLFFLIFLLILLVGVIGFLIHNYHQRNRIDQAFTFVRFRSAASDVELELDNPGLSDSNGFEPIGQHFRQHPNLGSTIRTSSRLQFKIPEFKDFRNIPGSVRNMFSGIGGSGSSQIPLRSQYDPDDNENAEESHNFENPVFKLTAQVIPEDVIATDESNSGSTKNHQ